MLVDGDEPLALARFDARPSINFVYRPMGGRTEAGIVLGASLVEHLLKGEEWIESTRDDSPEGKALLKSLGFRPRDAGGRFFWLLRRQDWAGARTRHIARLLPFPAGGPYAQ